MEGLLHSALRFSSSVDFKKPQLSCEKNSATKTAAGTGSIDSIAFKGKPQEKPPNSRVPSISCARLTSPQFLEEWFLPASQVHHCFGLWPLSSHFAASRSSVSTACLQTSREASRSAAAWATKVWCWCKRTEPQLEPVDAVDLQPIEKDTTI